MFIAVSQAHNEPNIDKQRFDLIRQSCVEALQKLKENRTLKQKYLRFFFKTLMCRAMKLIQCQSTVTWESSQKQSYRILIIGNHYH